MLAIERHRQLLKLLQTQESVRTADVARALGVTEETVRRDFEKLESDGVLQRSHGGAVRIEAQRREFPVRERATQNAAAKRRIAQAALKLIHPGQTVFFDPSTTIQELARQLVEQPLTVLTNSLQIAMILAEKPTIKTVLVGGNLMPNSLSCVGWGAEQSLDLYRVDSAFISCRGIDPERGLSEATEEQARLKRLVLERAEAAYLLADASKCGLASNYFFTRNSGIDAWITDAPPPEPLKASLTAQGVRIEVVAA